MRVSIILLGTFLYSSMVFSQDQEPNEVLLESMESGAMIYEDFCVNCHMADGKGVENLNPPLASSDFLMNNRGLSIKTIKFGQKGEIVVNGKKYNNTMTPLGLADDEIADVMNFISNAWGNLNNKIITVEEVSKIQQ